MTNGQIITATIDGITQQVKVLQHNVDNEFGGVAVKSGAPVIVYPQGKGFAGFYLTFNAD
jgi:hypothetical protein